MKIKTTCPRCGKQTTLTFIGYQQDYPDTQYYYKLYNCDKCGTTITLGRVKR